MIRKYSNRDTLAEKVPCLHFLAHAPKRNCISVSNSKSTKRDSVLSHQSSVSKSQFQRVSSMSTTDTVSMSPAGFCILFILVRFYYHSAFWFSLKDKKKCLPVISSAWLCTCSVHEFFGQMSSVTEYCLSLCFEQAADASPLRTKARLAS